MSIGCFRRSKIKDSLRVLYCAIRYNSGMPANPFRQLPAVAAVLESPGVQALGPAHGHEAVANAVRAELESLRERLKAGESLDGALTLEWITRQVAVRVEAG